MLLFKALLLFSILFDKCVCDSWNSFVVGPGIIQDLKVLSDDNDTAWKEIIQQQLIKFYSGHHAGLFHQIDAEEMAIRNDKAGNNSHHFNACLRFSPQHTCSISTLAWNELKLSEGEKLLKVDMVLIKKMYPDYPLPVFYMNDWINFGYPVSTFVVKDSPYMKFKFVSDTTVRSLETAYRTSTVFLSDPADRCHAVRPRESMIGADTMNTALYVNMMRDKELYSTPAFFFVKKESQICVYKFLVEEFMDDNDDLEPKEFFMLENYPTDGYAPKFFAFDPLYGVFVSLYWNNICKNHPEVHFFVFNQQDPTKTQLIDKLVLNDFDEEALEEIFAANYSDKAYPNFSSWGGQIFISFTKAEMNQEFVGLWTNSTAYFTMKRGVNNNNEIWRAKQSFARQISPATFNPAKPHDNVPSASSITQAPYTQCHPATTTTIKEAHTTSTTMKSTTTGEYTLTPATTTYPLIVPDDKSQDEDEQNIKETGRSGITKP